MLRKNIFRQNQTMNANLIRQQLVEKIRNVPDNHLPALLDYIEEIQFDSIQSEQEFSKKPEYGGCWNDMPENVFEDLMTEIDHRRHHAFTNREHRESNTC